MTASSIAKIGPQKRANTTAQVTRMEGEPEKEEEEAEEMDMAP